MSVLRVTNSTITNRFLTNVQANFRDLAATQEQISTGQRVNRPSDDPLASAQARLRNVDLDSIAQSKKSADAAKSWLDSTDTGLSSINDLLQRANELTIQGANSTYSAAQRSGIADEIDQLIASSKQIMNGKSGDAYIFSGTKTDTPPYNAGSDTYQGDANSVSRDLGGLSTIEVNARFDAVGSAGTPVPITAGTLLGQGTGAADGRVLDTLEQISSHLRSGAISALGSTDLQNLKANLTAVGNARAAVGAASNRVDSAVGRMDEIASTTTQMVNDLTGTDLTKAITTLSAQQNAYTAALKSGATIVQTSLMDFIR